MIKVYCLKNESNQIVYVGQTRSSLSKRLDSHKRSCESRINCTIELIAELPTQESAFILEALLIKQYNLTEVGLNKSTGYNQDKITDTCWREHEKDKTNGFYKHDHTDEFKRTQSERAKGNKNAKGNPSRKGRKNGNVWKQAQFESHAKKVMCIESGEVFESARECARKLDLQYSKISMVCNGKRKSTGGLTFRFV